MRTRFGLVLAACLVAFSFLSASAYSQANPETMIVSADVPIGGGLKANIYSPISTKPKGLLQVRKKVPVLLWVHGGGWVKGTREKIYNLDRFATQRGWVLVSMDYRKIPRTNIDGQVTDVVRAIRWIRNNIGKFGGDAKKIALIGHSAGSHLVSMVAVKKLGGKLKAIVANDVQGYDMVAYAGLRGSIPRVYSRAFGHNPKDWVRWSPITYIRRGTGAGVPPFLIMYSGSDYERRKTLAKGFATALKAKGVRASLFDGGRYTHGSIARGIGTSQQVTVAVERFLKTAFR